MKSAFIFITILIVGLTSSCTYQKDTFQIKTWHVINANKDIDRHLNDTLFDLSKLKFSKNSFFSRAIFDSIINNSKRGIDVKYGEFVFQIDTIFNFNLNGENLSLTKIIISSYKQNFAYEAIYTDKYGIIVKNYNGHGVSLVEHIKLFKDNKLYKLDLEETTKKIQEMNLCKRKDAPPPPPMKSN